jgi:hypothetical protein
MTISLNLFKTVFLCFRKWLFCAATADVIKIAAAIKLFFHFYTLILRANVKHKSYLDKLK